MTTQLPPHEWDPSLGEVRRKLKAAGQGFSKALQKVFKSHSKKISDQMRGEYTSDHPTQSGAGLRSIRPYATQDSASIQIGGDIAPYLLGQNFGSNQGLHKKQFPARGRPDYYLYTNVKEDYPSMIRDHEKAVDELMEEAFPDG